MNTDVAPDAGRTGKIGALAGRIVRRGLAVVGFGIATLVLITGPLLYAIARGLGAGGDAFQRLLIGIAIAFVLSIALGIVGVSDWSLSTIARSRVTQVVALGLLAAIGWAAIGIDSTRAVTSIPEASLTYPGAIETYRQAAPAKGGLNQPARAQLVRSFQSAATADDIEAFYRTEMNARGWTYSVTYGFIGGGRAVNWDRDEYSVQLRLVTTVGVGSFTVVVFGPIQ